MSLYSDLLSRTEKLALVGLGYVGMPIAIAFSKYIDVIGFDICSEKIAQYKSGLDPTNEVGNDAIAHCAVDFTDDPSKLEDAQFFIVAVPTPVNTDHTPNLTPLISASRTVGNRLKKGSMVVFESTVFPGATEEICVPILEKESGLTLGEDFKVGYSPERINPGDREHRLETIIKVVSGIDSDSLEEIAHVYSLIIDAGVYQASSIKVAEAAKVIENSQRDINIAFMNELAIIFHKMGIETKDVLDAASTKWNFLNFTPGLVGGHCIGVDPYYLTHRAEEIGYHSQVILSGRRINDGMGKYVSECVIKKLLTSSVPIRDARVAVLGFSFKENCPDTRNTKVIDVINELREYGVAPIVFDPIVSKQEIIDSYGIELISIDDLADIDAVIITTGHKEFGAYSPEDYSKMFKKELPSRFIFDVKGIYDRHQFEAAGFEYWRL